MRTLFSLLLLMSIANSWANPIGIGKALYPNNNEDQDFVANFLKIVEVHKTKDPLLEGAGPSIAGYSLDHLPFAFMVNLKAGSIDLVIFNWKFTLPEQFVQMSELSDLYGSPVFKMANVSKQKVATQGENLDTLTNFSYVMGADHQAELFKLDYPGDPVPDDIQNFKPHPLYMDASDPLRKALGAHTLPLLSPEKKLLYDSAPDMSAEEIDQTLNLHGGFFTIFLNLMIHEIYHLKEGDDHASRKSIVRMTPSYGETLAPQLTNDPYLVELFNLYAKIVFSLSDRFELPISTAQVSEDLSHLKAVVLELKSKYPEGWSYIRNYEYTEGFASYAASFSMVEAGIESIAHSMTKLKNDPLNNFVYRTGAIGGYFLTSKLNMLPFARQEDHTSSVWEIILEEMRVKPSSKEMALIIQRYQSYPFNEEVELANVLEYVSQH